MISLVSYGIGSGGAVGNLLYQLENMGFFSYVLPFLMIFVLIYAILSKAKFLGDNNVINVILSLVVALMALQFNFVSYFFAEIFPRMGVLLSILLVAVILMSLFVDFDSPGAKWGFGILTGIGAIVIVLQSFDDSFGFGFGYGFPFGGNFGWWLEQYLPGILVFVFIVGGIVAVVLSGKKKKKKKKKFVLDDSEDE